MKLKRDFSVRSEIFYERHNYHNGEFFKLLGLLFIKYIKLQDLNMDFRGRYGDD